METSIASMAIVRIAIRDNERIEGYNELYDIFSIFDLN